MSTPASLRPTEEVIEEFGLSPKFSYLLGAAGAVVFAVVLWFRVIHPGPASALAAALGPAGPMLLTAATLLVLLTGLYLVGLAVFFRFAYRYYLTTERVIQSDGVFSQHIVSAEYKAISDITVRQDAISHLFLGTGTLAINTVGGVPEDVVLMNIDNPVARREQLRGLAAAAHGGRRVTRSLLNELERQTGMEPAGTALSPVAGQPLPPVPPTPPAASVDEDIDDLHDDGIDDSDRLRAAQRQLPDQ